MYNTTADIIVSTNAFHATRPTQAVLVEFDSFRKYAVIVTDDGAKWCKVTSTTNGGLFVGVSFWTSLQALTDLINKECVFTPYDNGNITIPHNKASDELRLGAEDMEVTDWLEKWVA
jgi:hypothetical protein